MTEIKEIQKKEIWEDFLSECEEKTFLQSWNWGEFQKMMGNKIWRLGMYENNDLILVCLVAKIIAKRGKFLLIQHGPNLKVSGFRFQVLRTFLDKLKEIGKAEKADFIRMAPLFERNKDNIGIFKKLGFRESPMHANAYEATLRLDIFLTEEEIFNRMRKTTRYLIRQGLKNADLRIKKSDKLEDIKIYEKLNQKVAQYQNFVPFSHKYVKNEFEVFLKDNQALLFLGSYKGEIVAAAVIIFWGDIGFYHQAALLPQYHKIPIAYLLQLEAIREAKKRGCRFYDFWGYIDPKKEPKHPWAGPTLFKMGFGGKAFEYVKTQDFPLSKKYWLTYLFEKLRKIKRGL